jgi:hypothetical protein
MYPGPMLEGPQVAKRKMEMLFVRGDGVILVCPVLFFFCFTMTDAGRDV